ncbi:hypothetical protein QWJ41_09365 [Nocardioides sp. SOB44]|uniref:Uncharacterized protein n=1 Tax=Nocardioides cremeus TaxID=3058044 RepID=A0ABT8TRF8_9ACTN|nr:hypothetical protein [Nocardioides cremeus]MDO3395924.1 hypothetical protein [Nocardioides cremeus]
MQVLPGGDAALEVAGPVVGLGLHLQGTRLVDPALVGRARDLGQGLGPCTGVESRTSPVERHVAV